MPITTMQHLHMPMHMPVPPAFHPLTSRHVAVIGDGASGLVAAREIRGEGHSVVVFEHGDQVSGTWAYTDKVESDPMGLDTNRTTVHSSLYRSLRTTSPESPWASVTTHSSPNPTRTETGDDSRVTGRSSCIYKTSNANSGLVSW